MKVGEMNAERLLSLYKRVADAPDAIPRLRRFVLDLAVRGKLVEQDPNDEPASVLLNRLSAEKAESPNNIPAGWQCVVLGSILEFKYGKGMKSSERLQDGPVPVFGSNGIVGYTDEPLTERSVIIVGRKGSAGALTLCYGPSWTTDVAYFVEAPSFFVLRYLFFVLQVLNLETLSKGVKPGLSRADVYPLSILIPPLAEQHRIVAKVDELMALLDRLEAARTAAEATRDRLTVACLARLTAPDTTPEAFPAHARFALDALPALTKRPDQIKSLRQTILNLAVRGKLVKQDPNDEPASKLLKRINEMKAVLATSGVIKKEKPLPGLDQDQMAFDPPSGWTWCRLGSLVLSSDAGWSPRTESHAREGNAWGVLKVSAVSWDFFDPNANKQLLPGAEPRLQAKVNMGDFLISRANTAELVARAVLVHEEPDNLMMSDKIVRLRLATELDHRFVWLVNNNADFVRDYYAANATGVSPSMKNVSRGVILNLPMPLPPLAEQHRIVAKVDALMALCDKLEAALATADTTKQHLLEALLRETLSEGAHNKEAA